MDQHQQHVDEMLERYLDLLDEYTRLRQSLSQLQSGVYQNIARANFSGERGMRYGQNHFDERMQASRLLQISVDGKLVPQFSVVEMSIEGKTQGNDGIPLEGGEVPSQQFNDEKADGTSKKNRKKNQNPLHWFGLLAPMPLRAAQTQSIQAVAQLVPRLVSINAEMLDLEIEVRRARKRRAKAEAVAEKKQDETSTETQLPVATVKTA
ncbi:hypothetical protein G7046_g4126 [Stylonectria norvegica]|nr:hypothetical protein G7046_g4126 [Stylonectria norvegica]